MVHIVIIVWVQTFVDGQICESSILIVAVLKEVKSSARSEEGQMLEVGAERRHKLGRVDECWTREM